MATQGNVLDEAVRKERMKRQEKDIKSTLDRIRHKILVMSGKGGVGKSSVAAYLAVSLARRGHRVGLMDVDLHGPSIPKILGIEDQPVSGEGDKLVQPVKRLPNLEVMSIGVLIEDKDTPTIWRGPLKGAAIRQFISDIQWGELDYLIIDAPPGTGDEPMTVAQTIPDAKALIVTTPQEVALADVRKSISFCRVVKMEIAGIVENMSGLVCPHCGGRIDLFGTRGGALTAERENLRLLATLPLEPQVVVNADKGSLDVLDNASPTYKQAFAELVESLESAVETD